MPLRLAAATIALCAPSMAQLLWEQKFPTVSPPGRAAHSMAYDRLRGVVVMFGGMNGPAPYLQDTWEWDGTTWTDRTTLPSPSPMLGQSLAYDSARGVVVAAGGNPVETWDWDGSVWTQHHPAVSPPAGSMTFNALPNYLVFDAVRGVCGWIANTPVPGGTADFWEWDGISWIDRPDPGLALTFGMVFDPIRGVTVVAGVLWGVGAATLEWDGTAWSSPVIGNLLYANMLFDEGIGAVVGDNDCGGPGAWNGHAWVPYPASGNTACRRIPAMAWDAGRQLAVRFGGYDIVFISAVYFPETWTRCSTTGVFVDGATDTYGAGCGNPAPSFDVVPGYRPVLGRTFAADVQGASLGIAFVAWGYSNTTWAGIPLPVQLDPIGIEGCSLWTSGDIRSDAPCSALSLTSARHTFDLPVDYTLVGRHAYAQAWTFQPLFNSLGVVLSNGLDILIGDI